MTFISCMIWVMTIARLGLKINIIDQCRLTAVVVDFHCDVTSCRSTARHAATANFRACGRGLVTRSV